VATSMPVVGGTIELMAFPGGFDPPLDTGFPAEDTAFVASGWRPPDGLGVFLPALNRLSKWIRSSANCCRTAAQRDSAPITAYPIRAGWPAGRGDPAHFDPLSVPVELGLRPRPNRTEAILHSRHIRDFERGEMLEERPQAV